MIVAANEAWSRTVLLATARWERPASQTLQARAAATTTVRKARTAAVRTRQEAESEKGLRISYDPGEAAPAQPIFMRP